MKVYVTKEAYVNVNDSVYYDFLNDVEDAEIDGNYITDYINISTGKYYKTIQVGIGDAETERLKGYLITFIQKFLDVRYSVLDGLDYFNIRSHEYMQD